MIGQTHNIEKLKTMITNNALPSFIIISGPRFTGKTTLAKEFCKIIGDNYVFVEPKIEAIREMFLSCQENTRKIFIIEDFETLSKGAQNSVLKIFEECPPNVHFIISTNNENYMLGTILSRGQIFRVEPYTATELENSRFDTVSKKEYWKEKDLTAFDTFINDLYEALKNKPPVYALDILREGITYDIQETGYFYLFIFEELDKYIKEKNELNFSTFLRYNKLINEFFDKANYKNIRQTNIVDKYTIKISEALK